MYYYTERKNNFWIVKNQHGAILNSFCLSFREAVDYIRERVANDRIIKRWNEANR